MVIEIKFLWAIFTPFLLLFNCFDTTPLQVSENSDIKSVDHSQWEALLKKYVDAHGNVDYSGFKKERHELNAYLTYLAEKPISDSAKKEERLAYFINLYNASTVQLILENYPLKSIKDIFRPWGKNRIVIGDKKISLGDIEHKILRNMEEPRIHFAINCASFSCPKLWNEAFIAEKMEEQLEKAASAFVNDSTKNKITQGSIRLSKIFDWYKKDFTDNGSLIDYLNRYSKIKIPDTGKIDYLKYDWRLNEVQ